MNFHVECYECKWSTVVASEGLEGWAKRHAEDDPTHSVTLRLIPEGAPESMFQERLEMCVLAIDRVQKRLDRIEGQRSLAPK